MASIDTIELTSRLPKLLWYNIVLELPYPIDLYEKVREIKFLNKYNNQFLDYLLERFEDNKLWKYYISRDYDVKCIEIYEKNKCPIESYITFYKQINNKFPVCRNEREKYIFKSIYINCIPIFLINSKTRLPLAYVIDRTEILKNIANLTIDDINYIYNVIKKDVSYYIKMKLNTLNENKIQYITFENLLNIISSNQKYVDVFRDWFYSFDKKTIMNNTMLYNKIREENFFYSTLNLL